MQAVLDAFVGVPALVRSGTLDLIAANSLARALYNGSTPTRHSAERPRFTFLDPRARQFWPDWDDVADDITAHLRAAADPLDRALTELVGELSTRSDNFRELWARHDVRAHGRGVKRFRHPVVGALTLRYDHFQLAAEPGLTMITYTAEPGTASHDNLSLLASWAASQGNDVDQRQSASSRPSLIPAVGDRAIGFPGKEPLLRRWCRPRAQCRFPYRPQGYASATLSTQAASRPGQLAAVGTSETSTAISRAHPRLLEHPVHDGPGAPADREVDELLPAGSATATPPDRPTGGRPDSSSSGSPSGRTASPPG